MSIRYFKGKRADKLNTQEFLVTVYIKKAFDSVSHKFFLTILPDFLKWIFMLCKSQESCVKNGGKTTCSFQSGKKLRQGDPVPG